MLGWWDAWIIGTGCAWWQPVLKNSQKQWKTATFTTKYRNCYSCVWYTAHFLCSSSFKEGHAGFLSSCSQLVPLQFSLSPMSFLYFHTFLLYFNQYLVVFEGGSTLHQKRSTSFFLFCVHEKRGLQEKTLYLRQPETRVVVLLLVFEGMLLCRNCFCTRIVMTCSKSILLDAKGKTQQIWSNSKEFNSAI